MADLTRLREHITTVEAQLAVMSQAAQGVTASNAAAQQVEIAMQQRYLDGLLAAVRLVTTDEANRPVIEVAAHPSIWATALRLAAKGAAADRARIKRGLRSGSIRRSEAATWSADNDLATEPIIQAVQVACRARPTWRRWFPDELFENTAGTNDG